MSEPRPEALTNYVSFELNDGTARQRIGHLNQDTKQITPLSFASGTAVESLYQVIEVGQEGLVASGQPLPLDNVKVLPPLTGRDVLAVGKNYSEHAKEFNASGYDASDKVDMPTHPVIFTKRSTSIIAQDEDILLHPDFTQTLDYEGEIGVIIGKGGFGISEDNAHDHVWGYTIINDVTAREKQRDHKQFFIGKSADTFCPMGPVAVPSSSLPKVLTVTTRVNSEERQKGTTEDLIFSVANLIKTLSESQTLRPGDVIATGTPAGVGFGLKPPQFLKAGDIVEISVTGLGTLRNKVASADTSNYLADRISQQSTLPIHNLRLGGLGLTKLQNGKQLKSKTLGNGPKALIFIHGLGGSMSFFAPVVSKLGLADSTVYTTLLYDFEGHGMSPTSAGSTISIDSLAEDLHDLIHVTKVPTSTEVTIIAHSMGCLVAQLFATKNPKLATNLIAIGPPPCPLPQAGYDASIARAAKVRSEGITDVATAVATAATSEKTKRENPIAFNAIEMSILAQDPEGYAKGCTALASARHLSIDFSALKSHVLIIAGNEDKVSPRAWAEKLHASLPNSQLKALDNVGHWHVFEDLEGTFDAIRTFLK